MMMLECCYNTLPNSTKTIIPAFFFALIVIKLFDCRGHYVSGDNDLIGIDLCK